MQLSRSRVYPLLVCSAARFSWWLDDRESQSIGFAVDILVFKATPPGYDVLLSVGVGATIAPVASCRGSRFDTSIVVTEAANNRLIDSAGRVAPPSTSYASNLNTPKIPNEYKYLKQNTRKKSTNKSVGICLENSGLVSHFSAYQMQLKLAIKHLIKLTKNNPEKRSHW